MRQSEGPRIRKESASFTPTKQWEGREWLWGRGGEEQRAGVGAGV